MAGPKGSKYYDVFLKYQLELVTKTEDIVIKKEGFDLLEEIEKVHSIVNAAHNLEMSYRKAWGILRNVEYVLGFTLVEKRRGGSSGGRTLLTIEGKALMDAYNQLNRDIDANVKETIRNFFRTINDIKVRI